MSVKHKIYKNLYKDSVSLMTVSAAALAVPGIEQASVVMASATNVDNLADAGLGTINAVRLCAAALAGRPLLVLLNRFDPDDDLHRRNAAWLRDEGLAVHTAAAEVADDLVARRRAT